MKTHIILIGLGIAIIVSSGLTFYKLKQITEQQLAIVQALGASGVLEQSEPGAEITVNRVIRVKDLPPK